jgi:hypothetical protein
LRGVNWRGENKEPLRAGIRSSQTREAGLFAIDIRRNGPEQMI